MGVVTLAWILAACAGVAHIGAKFYLVEGSPGLVDVIHSSLKPIPIFILQYLLSRNSTPQTFMLLGLVFSSVGDIMLLPTVDIFIGGLGSFFVAHVFYIAALGFPKLTSASVIVLAVAASYGCGMYVYLEPNVEPELKIPVMVYAAIIATMAWCAVSKPFSANPMSIPRPLPTALGALLFVASDSCLALQKFDPAVDGGVGIELAIMSTYYAAQALLCAAAMDSGEGKGKRE